MIRTLKGITILFFLSGILNFLYSQDNLVKINHQQFPNGDFSFYSFNKAYCDYYVSIDFNTLSNLYCSAFLPFHGTVAPGKTQLFKLIPMDMNQPTQFFYNYYSIKGCGNCTVDTNFVYILPYSKSRDYEVTNISKYPSDNKNCTGFKKYEISFGINQDDTIYAIRSGVVSDIIDFNYSKFNVKYEDLTSIEVYHNDGTFAHYDFFRKGSELVRKGQQIKVGEPLAVYNDLSKYGIFFNLGIYYLDKDKIDKKVLKVKGEYPFLKPTFITKNHSVTYLNEGFKYEPVCPDSIIFQDMTKREIKMWKKQKK